MSESQKVAEIKLVVNEILARSDVQTHVRDALKQILDEDVGRKGVSEQAIIDRLREEGVLHTVFEQIRSQIRDAKKKLASPEKLRDKETCTHRIQLTPNDVALKLAEAKDITSIDILREQACELRGRTIGENETVRSDRRYLLVEIRGGRAFLEHIDDDDDLQGKPPSSSESVLRLHVHFRGSRFVSRPVRCACEPRFNELFIFDLGAAGGGSLSSTLTGASSQFGGVFEQLLAIGSEPLHLVVTRHDEDGRAFLVASSSADWRDAISAPRQTTRCGVELHGAGPSESVAVGVLECRFSVLLGGETSERHLLDMYVSQSGTNEVSDPQNAGNTAQTTTPTGSLHDALEAQRAFERSRRADADRLFIAYARKWWRELLQLRSGVSQRFVKLFARDETGTSRFVSTYVRPLRASRILDSPRAAARFVSVLPFERGSETFATGVAPETDGDSVWLSAHAFLAASRGDAANHAVLLCSLLLGFGLDAYVALGTKARRQPHAWVVTLDRETPESTPNQSGQQTGKVTFWESVTGFRYTHSPRSLTEWNADSAEVDVAYPYRTVGCVFNDRRFFANVQSIDAVPFVAFDLANESHWKAVNEQAIASLKQLSAVPANGIGVAEWFHTRANSIGWSLNAPVPLLPTTIDPIRESDAFEAGFSHLVMLHRRDRGMTTSWDEQLSYMLNQAIASYELERLSGVESTALGIDEFQQAVRNYIPEGHTFKAFPIQFVHQNPRRAFQTCLKSNVFCDVLECRGDQVRLATRARVYPYAELACATWLILACKFKSVM